ncbi:MAG: sodium:alanine symporter family protein [Synergistaceae bacterium]|nr:sodium:alanine symporter family protein [Synergistaceae bacterium]
METFFRINGVINGIVWGPAMLCLIVGTGVYLSIFLGFPQLRYFKMAWKEVFNFKKNKAGENDKSISSFAALATAMSATVGTGNIAGVATALHLGGPGAVFWMLVSAFFGMCTKFGEIALAVNFRQKDEHGDWRGGTMYILEYGARQKWLSVVFAVFAFLASFGIGAAVQANSTSEGLSMGFGVNPMHSGIGLVVLTGLVIIGGLKSLSTVTTLLVPFMSVFYIVGSMIVLVMHIANIPAAIGLAVRYAFEDPMAIPGALAGWSVAAAVRRGIARGVFSNEAGLGSAPMVHAAANTDHPIRQALYGLFEVFVDTMVICAMTALVILSTGSLTGGGAELTGARLTLYAFEYGLGTVGTYVLSLGLALFAFTTILGWYWYGETAGVYLFGVQFKPIMKLLWIAVIFMGAAGGQIFGTVGNDFLNNVWDVADTLNALMAIPNLLGLLILSGVLRKLVKDFDEKRKSGELKV